MTKPHFFVTIVGANIILHYILESSVIPSVLNAEKHKEIMMLIIKLFHPIGIITSQCKDASIVFTVSAQWIVYFESRQLNHLCCLYKKQNYGNSNFSLLHSS